MTSPRRTLSLALLALCQMPLTASGQFYGNAVPAELLDLQSGSVWFGSVRDGSGEFLADATVLLDSGVIEYVAVTDLDGRFRLVLPESTVADEVTPFCAHPGFSTFELRLRRPGRERRTPVELSCTLR
ncbi:MAG: carboxypeptidase-like regulatory domain-containing protein [Pseudomonadota bacterium]